jgi:hypothetical protein
MVSQWLGSLANKFLQGTAVVAATLASGSVASAQVPMTPQGPPGQVTPFSVQPTVVPACPAASTS